MENKRIKGTRVPPAEPTYTLAGLSRNDMSVLYALLHHVEGANGLVPELYGTVGGLDIWDVGFTVTGHVTRRKDA